MSVFVDNVATAIPYAAIFNLAVTASGFGLAFRKYSRDREKDERERQAAREATIERDATRHAENTTKMNTLIDFHKDQLAINKVRDIQIAELKEQTTQLKAQTLAIESIAKATNRRLERLEDHGMKVD